MLRPLLRTIADLALPPRCPGCGDPVDADGRFCAACWKTLRFVGPPWCVTCNLPMVIDAGPAAQCDDCLACLPRHDGIRAAVAYGPIARRLALKLKYGGRIGVAETMARLMARHLPADAELIVPVPLNRWRLWTRGYNQAQLIGQALARRGGPPCAADVLVRTKRTPALKDMSAPARARAVAGAFMVTPAGRERIAGRRLVLVDDIHTSGATANACVDVLLAVGAADVSILCWARVLADSD